LKLRKALVISVAIILLFAGIGCANKTTTPTPPPPGALNQTDANINTTLQTLWAFTNSMVTQNNTGQVTLTTTQKADLNALVTDLNVVDALYQAWHAAGATGSTTQITTAITKAQTDQTTLNAAIQGGK
jgi:hypothetical protein